MYNVTEQLKTAIAQPSRTLRSRVSFPDTLAMLLQPFSLEKIETNGDYPYVLDDEYIKSIVVNDSLVFGTDFEIGIAPMASATIEIIWNDGYEPTYEFEGAECNVELGLVLPDDTVEYVPMGKYTIESAVSKNNTLTLKAVDRIYMAEKDYVSDILYPATLLDILQSACDQAGIELATTSFANSDYTVPNEPVFENITCRKIFAQIAELAGGYAVINRNGELEIRTLGNTLTREITKDHYIEFSKDKVANSRIDTVLVRVGSEQAAAGTGQNPYSIVDNMFVQNPHNVVDAIYNVLGGLEYVSGTCTWQGDFSLDLGDRVTVDGETMYLLDRSLRYTGGLRETTKAPAVSNIVKESTTKGSMTLEIEQHRTQIKVLRDEITQTVERIDNLVVGANNRLLQSNTNIELDSDNEITTQRFLNAQQPYYKVTSSQPINLYGSFPNSQFAEPLGDLGESTVSIDVLTEVDSTVAIDGKEYEIPANRWTRIHVTKIFYENTTKHIRHLNPYSRKNFRSKTNGTRLIDSLTADTNTLYYRNLKVEKGNLATDWNLTPEELEANVVRLKSEIRQLADRISLLVSQDELMAELQILANMISSKVSEEDFSTLITQNARSVVTAIDSTDGVGRVKTTKVTIDEAGLTVDEGAVIVRDGNNHAIMTSDGLKILYQYTSSGELNGWQPFGVWGPWGEVDIRPASINVYIPSNLIIETATLYARSMPSYWTGNPAVPNGYYHARNLRLYKGNVATDGLLDWPYDSEYWVVFGLAGRTDITSAVWGSVWTPTGQGIKERVGSVKPYLTAGQNHNFIVETTDSPTEANSRYMGAAQLELVITGFLRG